MGRPAEQIARLRADADSGVLEALCARLHVDLLVAFGSVLERPDTAGDVDLAYSFLRDDPGDHLDVVTALMEHYGEGLDVMCLDRAGVVARWAALGPGEVLVERTPQKYAVSQMTAFGQYRDTHRLRELQLRTLIA